MKGKGNGEVEVEFKCGHKGFATDTLFSEGECIPILCRVCKPTIWRWIIPIAGIVITVAVAILVKL